MTTIDLGKIKVQWQGTYNNSTTYEEDDAVYYDGSAYVALQTVVGVLPSTLGSNWSLHTSGTTASKSSFINAVTSFSPTPTIDLSKKVSALSITNGHGGYNKCNFLMANGTIKSTGDSTNNANGDIATRYQPNFVQPASNSVTFTSVYDGNYENFAIDTNGNVWAWGYNGSGQLGIGNINNQVIMQKVIFPAGVKIAKVIPSDGSYTTPTANRTTFFITAVGSSGGAGQVYATGDNSWYQLGQGGTGTSAVSTPVLVTGLTGITITNLYATGVGCSVYAISSTNTMYVWGWNQLGTLGTNNTIQLSTPTLSSLTGVAKVSCASSTDNGVTTTAGFAIALKTNGTLWGTGYNGTGQLGLNNITNQISWQQIILGIGANTFTDVLVNDGYYGSVMAIDATNSVWSWGYNGYGQLGNGSTSQQNTALILGGAFQTKVVKIKAGGTRNFGTFFILTNDNKIYAAGNNNNGALGNGTTDGTSHSTFTAVAGINGTISDFNVYSEQTSGTYVMVLLTDGRVMSWGYNNGAGQTGTRVNAGNQLTVADVMF